jgi:hypothetical protein
LRRGAIRDAHVHPLGGEVPTYGYCPGRTFTGTYGLALSVCRITTLLLLEWL